ncbi:MAG: hypothetical protein IPM71_04880 [Bacteroidota bacterium]|nr:MAG: hypothetical protein IPM71_04880 [Bacteroidota bacterium]
MGPGFFWGVLLIVIGLSIIFKVVFGISIMRVVIAIVFIFIGIRILIGKPSMSSHMGDSQVVFNNRIYTEFPTSNTEYSTVFGKSVYNFGDAAIPTDKGLKLEFNTVFGDSQVILPEGLPVRIKAEAVFGAVKLPNGNTAAFGSSDFVSDHDSALTHFVQIEANAVFGNIDITQKKQGF